MFDDTSFVSYFVPHGYPAFRLFTFVMEAVVKELNSSVAVASAESSEILAKFGDSPPNAEKIESLTEINKLAIALKMGPLHEVVQVSQDSAELAKFNSDNSTFALIEAKSLDSAYLTNSLVEQL